MKRAHLLGGANARRVLVVLALALGASSQADERVTRGEYLTTILGCMGCHTQGYFTGGPFGAPFAGSRVGITYEEGSDPVVVYPANITPHYDTGIGRWSVEEIARAVNKGTHQRGGSLSQIMPWARYSYLTDEDAMAIAYYLKSLMPVLNRVPRGASGGGSGSDGYVQIRSIEHGKKKR